MKDNSYASDEEIESSGYYIENVDEEDHEESGAESFMNALLAGGDEFFGEEEDE